MAFYLVLLHGAYTTRTPKTIIQAAHYNLFIYLFIGDLDYSLESITMGNWFILIALNFLDYHENKI